MTSLVLLFAMFSVVSAASQHCVAKDILNVDTHCEALTKCVDGEVGARVSDTIKAWGDSPMLHSLKEKAHTKVVDAACSLVDNTHYASVMEFVHNVVYKGKQ